MSGLSSLRILGKQTETHSLDFTYNGVRFNQDSFHIAAGLNSVDTREYVEQMFAALKEFNQPVCRMGAYKPRTNPYSFQGHGKSCLPMVFELAGKYDIKIISMEVTHESHIDELNEALHQTGNPTGVMLQIGTRNTQNFELLKAVGSQKTHPVLFKRGFGITLDESLQAAEYVASEGNRNILFCLRGMKTNLGDPHRNLIDFGHVSVVKRLTRMPVAVDPSHSVGSRGVSPDGIFDIFHVATQGVASGANLVLTDVHPVQGKALVDAAQAINIKELAWHIEDCMLARELYLKRVEVAKKYLSE
jgi:3-deoxy-7-phosphoheptulonate synthase